MVSTENLKILNILEKALVISIICDKCGSKHKRIFQEKESNEILLNSWFN